MTFAPPGSFRAQRGVAILDALIAFVVLAFGLLAIAGSQMVLSRNSDLAKQRTEAVRLAHEHMENLRTFATLAPYDAAASQAAANVTGYASNTTYQIARTVNTSTDPDFKLLQVNVTWADRVGETQTVTVDSTIAGIDPKMSGRLTLSQAYAGIKRPRDRAVSVPYPSKSLSSGTESVFKPVESGTRALVFNNSSGDITRVCTVSASVATDNLSDADLTTNCTTVVGYLLSGYLRFDLSNNPSAETDGHAGSDNLPLGASLSMALTTLAQPYPVPSGYTSPYECFAEQRKAVKYGSSGNTRQIDVPYSATTPYTDTTVSPSATVTSWSVVEYYTTYSCVVFPTDHDLLATTRRIWTGATNIASITGQTIGNGSGNVKICRYSFDYNNSDTSSQLADSNSEHPATYTAVDGNLTDQNFLVVKGRPCPSDNDEIDPLGSPAVYANFNTIQQQP